MLAARDALYALGRYEMPQHAAPKRPFLASPIRCLLGGLFATAIGSSPPALAGTGSKTGKTGKADKTVADAAGSLVPFQSGFPVTSRADIYPLAQVKRGDQGTGYTVLAGDEIVSFSVEVLGLLRGMLGAKRDVILARLGGREIEFTGVIAGMSGSPVYIDGRLVGAVAYRFGAFSKEPIAGITPIESMLDVYGSEIDAPNPTKHEAIGLADGGGDGGGSWGASSQRAHGGIKVSDFRSRDLFPRLALRIPRTRPMTGLFDPSPIETPIVIAGLDPRVMKDLQETLADAGFVAMAGGCGGAGGSARGSEASLGSNRRLDANVASSAGGARAAPIAPGAPLAAILMRGDIYVAATGTVTFVDGKDVLAFGHPFLGFGRVVFPMATASILNTLASEMGSYKQGAPALEVGTITQDRLTAIAGRLGDVAPMVPIRVLVRRFDDPVTAPVWAELNAEIVKSAVWLPTLTGNAIASAAISRLGFEAGGTVDVDVSIEVGDRTLTIRDSWSAPSPTPVGLFAARDIANILGLIGQNQMESADILGIQAEMRIKPDVSIAWIEKVIPDRTTLRPGEVLGLTARLRPYRGDPIEIRLSTPIPSDVRGDVEVFVAGGVEMDRREGDLYGDRYPRTLDDLLGILADRRPARALYARTVLPRHGLKSDVEIFSSLPPSQRATLMASPARTLSEIGDALGPETHVVLRDIVVGATSLHISIVP